MHTAAKIRDPRCFQIAALGLLAAWGMTVLDCGIHPGHALAILLGAQAAQYAGTRLVGLGSFDPLSAMVTTLSLILLLRTNSTGLAALAAIIAIGSKFLVRINGKHLFNPANVAIVTMMVVFDGTWISTGQWGNATTAAFAFACLGILVLTRARRAETTVAFLASYTGLLLVRTLWLGDPFAILLHHLQNGALLIFAFFMISDPKTAPDSAACRAVYGFIVAAAAFVVQFLLYQPNGPVLALILCAPLVPLLDLVHRGPRYHWNRAHKPAPGGKFKGVS